MVRSNAAPNWSAPYANHLHRRRHPARKEQQMGGAAHQLHDPGNIRPIER